MKKILQLLLVTLFFISMKVNSQTLYFEICKDPCEKCKPDFYNKVEYLADPTKKIVLRTFTGSGGKTVHSFTDCDIVDKNNWVCPPTFNAFSKKMTNPDAGKQFASKGVAYWISSGELSPSENYCIWDKNAIGKFVLRR